MSRLVPPAGRVGRVLRRLGGLILRERRAPPPAPAAEPPPPAPEEDGLPLEVEVPVPGSLLLDIREPGELAYGVAPGAKLLPMNLVPHHLGELPRDRPITVYCAAGARSFGVAHWLREQGFPLAVSLAGGLSSLQAAGTALAPPPGRTPGTWMKLPPNLTADGAPLGPAERSGEVIEERDGVVYVVIRDEQGFLVRVEVPAS
jgi:rhodanese-related sulfurtransferase